MPTLAVNKRAHHDYEISERFEAGIRLSGPEVKSVKFGHVDLVGSYARITPEGGAVLMNASIAPYSPAATVQTHYNPRRDRELLLRRSEIASLIGSAHAHGRTIIPLSVYTKRGLIKVELGLGRGKKLYDKREAIRKRDADRLIRSKLRHDIQ